jgi:hypothetical protein
MTDPGGADVEPIGYTCTQADLLAAQQLHHTITLKGRRFLIGAATPAVMLAVVFTIGFRGAGISAIEDGFLCAALYLSLVAVQILVTRLVVLPRAARRQFLQLKVFGGPLKVGVSSPRIVLTTKDGVSEMPTEDFLKWAENGKSILLYRSDRQFNFLPKRVVSPAFHQSLVSELTRAGVLKAGFSNS